VKLLREAGGGSILTPFVPLSRAGLNSVVIAGAYEGGRGVSRQRVSISPEGRFESGKASFGYDVGLDCTFAACDYLLANDGSRDDHGFPLRYGFSRSSGGLDLFPVSYEGDERMICGKTPLMRLDPRPRK
jgi:hypothetical protein